MLLSKLRWVSMFALAATVTVAGCAGGSPVSPSTMPSVAGPGTGFSSRPMEGKDDGATPVPETGVSVIISIVGSFGTVAYDPNPVTAAVGDTLVWTNNNRLTHHIILDDPNYDGVDDSIDIGIVAPGESSLPVLLARATGQFHCAIHPSMKGGINEPPVEDPEPPPYDPYRLRTSVVK